MKSFEVSSHLILTTEVTTTRRPVPGNRSGNGGAWSGTSWPRIMKFINCSSHDLNQSNLTPKPIPFLFLIYQKWQVAFSSTKLSEVNRDGHPSKQCSLLLRNQELSRTTTKCPTVLTHPRSSFGFVKCHHPVLWAVPTFSKGHIHCGRTNTKSVEGNKGFPNIIYTTQQGTDKLSI